MTIFAILLLAVALSMDAMAVAIGTCTKRNPPSAKSMLIMAISFGVFQGVMPLLGYALGQAGASLVESFDHWLAFGLLAFVGGKMLWEGFHANTEGDDNAENLTGGGRIQWHTLLVLSIATSIDAAAVGISLSLIRAPIIYPSVVIGLTTFALSWLGGRFGKFLGARLGKLAEVLGGLVLLGIGAKIVYDHLGM